MNAVYPKFREQLLEWALNASQPGGILFYVVGVDSDYVFGAAHTSLADVVGTDESTPRKLLTGVTITDGTLDANDLEFDSLEAGKQIQSFVVYAQDTADSTYLVCYLDTSADGSLPVTVSAPSGLVRWNAAGICKI